MGARIKTHGWVFLALTFLTDSEAKWAAFDACGFQGLNYQGGETQRYTVAPNIVRVWVRPRAVTAVYLFKTPVSETKCVHLRVVGTYDIIVVGTPESVLQKLEESCNGKIQRAIRRRVEGCPGSVPE